MPDGLARGSDPCRPVCGDRAEHRGVGKAGGSETEPQELSERRGGARLASGYDAGPGGAGEVAAAGTITHGPILIAPRL